MSQEAEEYIQVLKDQLEDKKEQLRTCEKALQNAQDLILQYQSMLKEHGLEDK